LNSRQQIQNSNELLTIQIGAKTTFLKRFTFDAGVSHSSIQNMRMYKDDVLYSSFSAVYDTVTSTKLSFYGELIYNYGDQSMFGLEVKFDNYETGSMRAYYRPTTQIILTGQHQLSDRVNVGLDLFYIDGLIGEGNNPAALPSWESLRPIVDLSLNAEFKLNKRWFAWTNVNNVFNKQYSYYLQYPSKGTNFLIGLNYSL
jgi:outer membrane receptor protein involved in Fe transport